MGEIETTAVILAGGVAKGAFEAGALEELAATNIQISQLVATSSGALNGSFLAAAIRAGRQRESAARLVTLWEDEANWMHSVDFDLKDLLSGVALSDSDKLLKLMHQEIEPLAGQQVNRISLKVVVGLLNGTLGNIGDQAATTYERVLPSTSTASRSRPIASASTRRLRRRRRSRLSTRPSRSRESDRAATVAR
jgi:predicted acylesterase/phospholipase RssA